MRSFRRLATAASTALAALAAVLTTPAAAVPAAAPTDVVTARLSDLIAALPVEAEGSRDGYSREQYRHWIDADRNGCNTRAEVLLRDAAVAPEITGRCTITADTGQWRSWYDENTLTDKGDVDIDHMVPLAESWDSGAAAWSAQERRAYANDLDDPRSLLAVTDRVNQAKADQDPAEWMPPATSATCRYIADWVTVKTRWGLSTDPAEHTVIEQTAGGCDNPAITLTRAR